MEHDVPSDSEIRAAFAATGKSWNNSHHYHLHLGSLAVGLNAPDELVRQWLLPACSRILVADPCSYENIEWRVSFAVGRDIPNMASLCRWIGRGLKTGIYETVETASGLLLYEHSSRFWLHMDCQEREVHLWLADTEALAPWEHAAPLKSLWHLMVRKASLQVVHGGAVGYAAGGAMLLGAGGAGKSTAALACFRAGLGYLADDYCLVDTSSQPVVHQLYTTAKLRPENLHRFEEVRREFIWQEGRPGAKPTLFLEKPCARQPYTSFPVRALILPKVTGLSETTWARCSATQAWRALAPSTLAQLPLCGEETFAKLTSLTRKLPAFVLNSGTNLRGIPHAINQILASV